MTTSPSHPPLRHRHFQEAKVAGSRRADETPAPRWTLWVILGGVVAAAAAGWGLTQSALDTEDANAALQGDKVVLEEQRDATAQQASTLADQVTQACAAGGDTAEDLLRVGACQQAQQVRAEPIPGERGERGPGPTAEQIRAAVAAYLVENPPPAGRSPTATEVSAAVTEYLTANPPAPGRAPTSTEIAEAVATYFATNPVRDGKPGRPPTAEEIRAAVDDYLANHPPPAGPRGEAGPAGPACPDGTTLLPVKYADERAGYGCVLDEQPLDQPPTTLPEVPNEGEGGTGGG